MTQAGKERIVLTRVPRGHTVWTVQTLARHVTTTTHVMLPQVFVCAAELPITA